MRGSKLFDNTDWKNKKKLYTFLDVLFCTESIIEEKRKVFIVRDEAPHFLRGAWFQPA